MPIQGTPRPHYSWTVLCWAICSTFSISIGQVKITFHTIYTGVGVLSPEGKPLPRSQLNQLFPGEPLHSQDHSISQKHSADSEASRASPRHGLVLRYVPTLSQWLCRAIIHTEDHHLIGPRQTVCAVMPLIQVGKVRLNSSGEAMIQHQIQIQGPWTHKLMS